jgi:Tfp pilus assembly protein PilN
MSVHRVNLIPAAILAAKRVRRRLRLWATLLIGYAGLIVAACVGAHVIWGSGHAALARDLDAARQAARRSNETLANLRREVAKAQDTQRTIQVVTEQPDWSLLIATLSKYLGDEAVLRESRLSPVVAAATPAKPNAPAAPQPARYKLELRGLARSQAAVSQFVHALESAGVFDDVKLVRTGREAYLTAMAVSFELECTLHDEARR